MNGRRKRLPRRQRGPRKRPAALRAAAPGRTLGPRGEHGHRPPAARAAALRRGPTVPAPRLHGAHSHVFVELSKVSNKETPAVRWSIYGKKQCIR